MPITAAAASTWRVLVGFGGAAVLGVGLGLLIGLSPLMEKLFDPTIHLVIPDICSLLMALDLLDRRMVHPRRHEDRSP